VDAMTHPLLRELLAMLPPPEAPFSRQRRQHWIEAAEAVLALVYGDDAEDAADDAVDDERTDAPAEVPAVEDHGGVSANGTATAWTPNGHEIAGRHRRIEHFGLS
jgi:hypothetical protein